MALKRLPDFSRGDIKRFWSKVDRKHKSECWAWKASGDIDKRGQFRYCRNGKSQYLKAPRVAWMLLRGYDPYPALVLHNCNNPNCCNPHHCRLGDDADNRRDSEEAGTHCHGTQHGMAKLTEDDVKEIRRALSEGTTGVELAERYQVYPTLISKIKNRHLWKHIPEEVCNK